MASQNDGTFKPFSHGSVVRIRQSHRLPCPGLSGTIVRVDENDSKGPYLVRFQNGTQFRYAAGEIESVQAPEIPNRFLEKIMKTHFQIILILVLASSAFLAACGPAPNPKLQAKPAEKQEESPATAVEDRSKSTAAEAPVPVAAEQPRQEPVTKRVPEQPQRPARAAGTPAPAPRSTVHSSTPASSTAATHPTAPASAGAPAGPPTLTLPAPAAPPIAVPVPPSDEVRAEPVKPEPPAPREVQVPSGTLVAVRMIDSVDSETGRLGETFRASLDEPIVVDNETIFPKGSEVYVKLSKVEAAGRVSGRSEVQLQLDRIFLGKKSYLLQSSTYASTGASQAGRTARSAGVGAAIGAAIGAISGGGKGAVIGGATGAGAGAGVEAIRKGEQVRIDTETRLEFRLEDPIDVKLDSSSSSTSTRQRNNPSGPIRFGTRQ
jgi:hypothetical protein